MTASSSSGPSPAATYLIPLAVVAALTLLLLTIQSAAESAAADVAGLLPFGFAFAAGMIASVNPCGFLMLPTYISYHLGTEVEGAAEAPLLARGAKGLLLGLVATLGFVVVSGAVGAIVAAGGRWLTRVFPYAGTVVGILMVGLGIWLLISRRKLSLLAASRVHVSPRRNLGNVFLFGIAYSIGSLSCTLPIFLVVVGSAVASGGTFLSSLGQFIAYALGMGLVMVIATVGASLVRGAVTRGMRRIMPYLDNGSAMFLVAAGGYLLYYWLIFARPTAL